MPPRRASGVRVPRKRFLGKTAWDWAEFAWIGFGVVVMLVLGILFLLALFASAWGPAVAWLVITGVFFGVWLAIGVWVLP